MLRTMFDSETPIPESRLVHSSRGNDLDYAGLIPYFVDELPSMQRSLLEFAKVCDYENVRREAHKLRGAAGGYGYDGLSDLAGQLEETCQTSVRDSSEILNDLERLVEYIERVRV